MINFYAKNITVFLIVLGCVVRIGHFVTTVTTKCGSQEQCECSYKEGSDENVSLGCYFSAAYFFKNPVVVSDKTNKHAQ